MPSDHNSKSTRSVPFSLAEALERGMTRREIATKVNNGEFERVAQGWYRVPVGTFSEEHIFQAAIMRIGKPAAVCLISALSFYDLTDTIPRKIWLMVPHEKRSKHKDLRLLRTRNPLWKTGVDRHPEFWITSIDRSIVDMLTYRSLFGSQLALDALREAIRKKKTTLSNILEMANKLEVSHRIRPYIEAMS